VNDSSILVLTDFQEKLSRTDEIESIQMRRLRLIWP
jgi:hypothetical protein